MVPSWMAKVVRLDGHFEALDGQVAIQLTCQGRPCWRLIKLIKARSVRNLSSEIPSRPRGKGQYQMEMEHPVRRLMWEMWSAFADRPSFPTGQITPFSPGRFALMRLTCFLVQSAVFQFKICPPAPSRVAASHFLPPRQHVLNAGAWFLPPLHQPYKISSDRTPYGRPIPGHAKRSQCCGKTNYRKPRIVGGSDARPSEFPWLVSDGGQSIT